MEALYSIVCHDGTFDGDCAFMSIIPITLDLYGSISIKNLTLVEVADLYKSVFVKEYTKKDWKDWGIEEAQQLKGAWVLKKEMFDKLLSCLGSVVYNRDGEAYALNSMMKYLFDKFCEFKIGKDPE